MLNKGKINFYFCSNKDKIERSCFIVDQCIHLDWGNLTKVKISPPYINFYEEDNLKIPKIEIVLINSFRKDIMNNTPADYVDIYRIINDSNNALTSNDIKKIDQGSLYYLDIKKINIKKIIPYLEKIKLILKDYSNKYWIDIENIINIGKNGDKNQFIKSILSGYLWHGMGGVRDAGYSKEYDNEFILLSKELRKQGVSHPVLP